MCLCFAAALSASCAHDSTPSLESTPASAGRGGKAASPANQATSGSSSVAGTSSSGGTTSSGFGGTSGAQGGNASGGTLDTAGSSNSGGSTSGGADVAGSGGGSTVSEDVLKRAKVIVYYRTSETTASSKKVQMKLNIVNQAPDPLPMAHVKIRYWATAEQTPELHNYYVVESFKPVTSEFVSAGDESHALMSFVGAPGVVAVGETDLNKSEIQLELATNTGSFDQSDDFSWDPSATSTPKPNPKITLYLDDVLIWGCEPSGKCFDDAGDGGAGGQGAGGQDAGGAGGQPAGGQPAGGQDGLSAAGQAAQGGAP
jgi:hypothetical protein